MVEFASRQVLDMVAPSNFPLTNPEILLRTVATGGLNLVKGFQNYMEDAERAIAGKRPIGADAFAIGRDVAKTPGKVIYRNHLIELIQYAPTTANVAAEPVLIIPAWIMKYYILDLSPANSLIGFLVAQGHTVFCISWRNPGAEIATSRSTTIAQGVMAALARGGGDHAGPKSSCRRLLPWRHSADDRRARWRATATTGSRLYAFRRADRFYRGR